MPKDASPEVKQRMTSLRSPIGINVNAGEARIR